MKGDVINETGAIYASALLYGYEQKAFLVEEKEEAARLQSHRNRGSGFHSQHFAINKINMVPKVDNLLKTVFFFFRKYL